MLNIYRQSFGYPPPSKYLVLQLLTGKKSAIPNKKNNLFQEDFPLCLIFLPTEVSGKIILDLKGRELGH